MIRAEGLGLLGSIPGSGREVECIGHGGGCNPGLCGSISGSGNEVGSSG